jgi:2,4-dienoyl-CoA reductase-like NADH-dependent reductase (Old Yellow Enzyme family)/thioredoxin reductase
LNHWLFTEESRHSRNTVSCWKNRARPDTGDAKYGWEIEAIFIRRRMMEFRKLLAPEKLGKLEIRNRIVMAPMVTRFAGDEGEVTERMVDYYVERARGGVGMVIVEAAYPQKERQPGRLSIYNDKFIPLFRQLLDQVWETGCKAAIQINPSKGRFDEVQPVCASDLVLSRFVPNSRNGHKPKVLSIHEIEVLISEFGQAVSRIKDIGFDAMVVHGAASYLVADFLSPLTNKRADDYGGDLKGRAKLAIKLLQSARRQVGDDYPIIFRLSVDQRVEGGFSLSDALIVCQMLEKAGCTAIDVLSGSYAAPEWALPSMNIPAGCNADMAAAVKATLAIPVMVAGRIHEPLLAEEILEQNKTDFVVMGRALIADPELPKKLREGRTDDIRRCLTCNVCYDAVITKGMPLRCTINAEVGREREWRITPADKRKKVLVIGGGPAGMEAARVCALRGHIITLWEKSDRLGGQLNLATVPPYKKEIWELLRYLSVQIKKAHVVVELNMEATSELVTKFGPDVVIIATGSIPKFPEIPGIREQKNKLLFAQEVLSGTKEVGESVVVIGGGSVGCETAEFLVDKRKSVIILEIMSKMATDLAERNRLSFLQRLEKKGVIMLTNVRYELITRNSLIITDQEDARKTLKPDSIVFAAGSVPDDHIFHLLQGKVQECYALGDCIQPGRILEAIEQAAGIGRKI